VTRLRELRQARGWSRLELARRAGVSEWTIWAIEQGHSAGRADTARKISRAFGLKPKSIFPAATEPEDVIERPSQDRATCFCGRVMFAVKMIHVVNAPSYAGRHWCSEACLEADIRTRPCAEGTCGCRDGRHLPE